MVRIAAHHPLRVPPTYFSEFQKARGFQITSLGYSSGNLTAQ